MGKRGPQNYIGVPEDWDAAGGLAAELKRVTQVAIAAGDVDLRNPQAVMQTQEWLSGLEVILPRSGRVGIY